MTKDPSARPQLFKLKTAGFQRAANLATPYDMWPKRKPECLNQYLFLPTSQFSNQGCFGCMRNFPKNMYHCPLLLAILCDLFGMVVWPFKGYFFSETLTIFSQSSVCSLQSLDGWTINQPPPAEAHTKLSRFRLYTTSLSSLGSFWCVSTLLRYMFKGSGIIYVKHQISNHVCLAGDQEQISNRWWTIEFKPVLQVNLPNTFEIGVTLSAPSPFLRFPKCATLHKTNSLTTENRPKLPQKERIANPNQHFFGC